MQGNELSSHYNEDGISKDGNVHHVNNINRKESGLKHANKPTLTGPQSTLAQRSQ
jgi:hypothetical protein